MRLFFKLFLPGRRALAAVRRAQRMVQRARIARDAQRIVFRKALAEAQANQVCAGKAVPPLRLVPLPDVPHNGTFIFFSAVHVRFLLAGERGITGVALFAPDRLTLEPVVRRLLVNVAEEATDAKGASTP